MDNGTLVICKGKRHADSLQLDRESLEKHLVKKLNRLETFDSLECHDKVLSYDACDYLADLIKERGTTPLNKVDL